ncbi:MAG: HEAT repeat domain-containing protein, partial [Candidatus Gastranaerophilales bacterium]|nr:HEAT repeat domain-containing protein [Candidatus Gastranaerophilales bacterium]
DVYKRQVYNPKVLMQLIRLSDKYRSSSSLGVLVDLLLMRINLENTPYDFDDLINVRVMCAKAIANIKDTSVVGSLLYCLNNKNENYKIRLACADALGKIGDRFAVAPLIDLMQDEDEKSVYLKESAVSALGVLGDSRAVDPLVAILETKQGFLDKFSFLKERVIEALGKLNINNNKIQKALKNSLYDLSPMVRINAIEAIMNSGDDDAAEIIKSCLNDDDKEVKKNALIALYNLLGRDILDEVIAGPQYDEFLRTEAAGLMEEYEGDEEDDE